ncbi:hypothetical protein [Aidingimonas halophila]|uniref:Phage tail tape measure protein, lambda family n=1 Tax=Aidingimonas halophila TaxID=574349 RepID=A0A1H2RBG2_9GAMM|nr:hypothetical protein [Aidingimonas halophila]GHC19509.1 hypothetical protein GCM10008094_06940 [Aidingimonas halophila]SDW16813.1 hypothetical protein SAMN05443545_101278 [Aidingimonas halophila]
MAVRSLGQLTLDLVAKIGGFTGPMNQAQRAAKRDMSEIARSVRRASSVITATAAAATAAGGSLVAFTQNAASNARELRNQAQLANAGTQEFQRNAYAAQTVGVEQGKLADILKDVNDRVGDFLATGGGPMADFFENIAPQIGVTAQQFRDLSGPQALQLYYDSLERANLSQQDMTFYLEAIASDTTALIPLLRNGGERFREMANEADQLGLVLSDLDIAQLEEFGRQFDRITGIMSNMSDVVAAELAPYLSVVADELSEGVDSADDFGEAFSRSLRTVVESTAPVLDALDKFLLAAKALRTFAYTMGQAYTAVFAEITNAATGALDFIAGGINDVISGFNRIPGIDDIPLIDSFSDSGYAQNVRSARDEIAKLAEEARQDLAEAYGAPPPSEGLLDYLDDVDRKRQQIADEYRNGSMLSDPGGTALGGGETSEELEKQRESYESLIDELYPVIAAQREFREDMELLAKADAAGAVDDLAEAQQRLRESVLSDRSPSDAYGQGMGVPGGLEGGFGGQIGQRDMSGMDEEQSGWDRWLESAETAFTDFDAMAANTAESFQRGFGEAFESMIFDSENFGDAMYSLLDGVSRTLVRALGEMAAQWLAYQAVQMLVGRQGQTQAVTQAATTGSSIAAAYAPAAALASLATLGGNAAPAATGIASTMALSQGMASFGSLSGMAHDGIDNVPNEGTWLLDKGERVMSSPQSDKLDGFLASQEGHGSGSDAPIINLIEDSSRAGQTQRRQDQDGRHIVDVVVADIFGDGRVHGALSRKYGLSTQGK